MANTSCPDGVPEENPLPALMIIKDVRIAMLLIVKRVVTLILLEMKIDLCRLFPTLYRHLLLYTV